MRKCTIEKAIIIGNFYLNNDSTVRETARMLGISHSMVHRSLTQDLPVIDEELASKVRKQLDKNREESPAKASVVSKEKRATRKLNSAKKA